MRRSEVIPFLKYYFLLYYYWYFKHDVILKALTDRKGKCKLCGKCCFHGIRCPFLKEIVEENDWQNEQVHSIQFKGFYCSIHGSDWRPLFCKVLPIRIKGCDFVTDRMKERECGYRI